MAGMATLRQPRGTAVALRDPLPWPAFAAAVRSVEAGGYAGVFLPEIAGRDAFAALTGLAGETSTLTLATGVVPMTSRSPVVTAMGAATVQERSGGRMILGLGTGPPAPGALERMRAQVGTLRAILDPASEGSGGERLSLSLPAPVPIWIAALGPRAVRLAGEVADGVLLNWCPPLRVAQARAAIDEAATLAGRDPAAVTLAVYVRASLGGDDGAAEAAFRVAAGQYASYPAYARQFAEVGLGPQAEAAAAAHRAGRPEQVPGDFVRALGLIGDPDLARERLQVYREAGADLAVVYPVVAGAEPLASLTATIRALAPDKDP
jgi:alkanesulfonate monooxygenase SsuD/methylene tetrahydromethanopterin reductase-like flavin-dependent oxidoreductase (luciferase family)